LFAKMAGPSGIEPSTCEFGAQQDQPEQAHLMVEVVTLIKCR